MSDLAPLPPPPCILSHVPDAYRHYPGEVTTIYTRLTLTAPITGFTLQWRFPPTVSLLPESAQGNGLIPQFAQTAEHQFIIWTASDPTPANAVLDFEISAQLLPTDVDLEVEIQALLAAEGCAPLSATLEITILAKSLYLKHLPGLYHSDEVMGRLLMLFESFWQPIETQIDHFPYIFDPHLTPERLLPWLASWMDLALDERWPVARRRELIARAVQLFQMRGTKRGLREYLRIYTGTEARLVEHGANNFRLGEKARLGPSIALGQLNQPHTFMVIMRLPPITATPDTPPDEIARRERQRRRIIESIIDAEKPAHTTYTLLIEPEQG